MWFILCFILFAIIGFGVAAFVVGISDGEFTPKVITICVIIGLIIGVFAGSICGWAMTDFMALC